MPVISSIAFGNLTTISNNSPVIFAAPTAPLPLDTIVTFLHAAKGAATSAATWKSKFDSFVYYCQFQITST